MQVRINPKGFRAVRSDPTLVALMRERAERIAVAANSASVKGAEYEVGEVRESRGRAPRARISVRTGNFRARLDNARANTLLKALGGGS